jgi:hypothetical protein
MNSDEFSYGNEFSHYRLCKPWSIFGIREIDPPHRHFLYVSRLFPRRSAMTPIRILHTDSEFERLIPPLARAERELLEASLKQEGCRDPLILWAGHNIILDGHNRWAICNLHDIPFRTIDLELPDREAVRNWLIQRQFSRRNLTAAGASYLRGKRYLAERGKWGGDRKADASGSRFQNETLIAADANMSEADTKQRLAKEFRVSETTIHRDAEFAAAVDALAANCGEQARSLILSGDARLTRQQVARLTQMPPEEQKRLFQEFASGGQLPKLSRLAKRTLPLADRPAVLARLLIEKLGVDQATLLYRELAALLRQLPPGKTTLKMPA